MASAVRTAAIVSGAVACAVAVWIARHKPALSLFALLAGAITGWIVGSVVGKMMFPAKDGYVFVAKAGLSSLPLTLKGNLVATFLTSITIAVLVALLTKTEFKVIAPASIGTAFLLGIISALMSSLL